MILLCKTFTEDRDLFEFIFPNLLTSHFTNPADLGSSNKKFMCMYRLAQCKQSKIKVKSDCSIQIHIVNIQNDSLNLY